MVSLLENIPKKCFNGTRKKYVTPIANLMNDTTSDKLLERLSAFARDERIWGQVKTQLIETVYKKVVKND